MPQSEPGLGAPAGPQQGAIPDAYSIAPGDGAINRAARADGVAAHHVEDNQNLQGNAPTTKNKRIDDVTKLVAEENASRSKFPKYAGLERWELIEKMGDGAFSNVYRARDREGNAGEVAIKVVRKFEMNSMQVSPPKPPAVSLFPLYPAIHTEADRFLCMSYSAIQSAFPLFVTTFPFLYRSTFFIPVFPFTNSGDVV